MTRQLSQRHPQENPRRATNDYARRRLTDAGSSRRHARGMPARPQFRRPALVRITHAAGRRSPARLLPHRARATAGTQITTVSTPGWRQSTGWTNLRHSLLEKTPTRRNTQQTRRTRTSYTRVTQQQHALTNKDTVDEGVKQKKNKKNTRANGEHSSSSRRSLGLTPIRPARSQQQPNAQRASEEEVCRRPRSKHSGRRSAVPHHASATVAVIVNQATQRQAKATDGGRVVVSRRRLRRRARELGPSSDENEARQGERKLRAKPADFGAAASSDHR